MLSDMGKKSIDVESVAKEAIQDDNVLAELLEGILSKKETIRYNSFKVLLLISEEHPELLCHKWDFLVGLLESDNTSHKYIAIYIIANLTRLDKENNFDKIFDKYYNLLNDKSIIPAGHVAGNSGKIARVRPELQAKITDELLSIDETRHEPERRELIKSYAIESFSEYFEEAKNKREIIEFVKKQLNSKSPRTRKKAKEFLEKWGN
jgi:hypothetical protein